jgi:tRNA(Ile)-lysidine synthase
MNAVGSVWQRRAGLLAAACALDRLHRDVRERAERSRGPWVVAFSGGADSLALLLLVWAHFPSMRTRLHAVHFNHRLRGAAADGDEAFCRRVCASLGVRIHVGRRRAANALRSETAAREARFTYFDRVLKRLGAKMLWLGHQQNDVAESLLLRLARGSGTGGLAAPRPVQVMRGGRVHLRPLLDLPHATLEAWLKVARIPWREDATNATGDHFRNRLRRDVIPAWARAADRDVLGGAARSRELLAEDDAALEAWADAAAGRVPSRQLELARLQGLPVAVMRRVLHRWLLRLPDRPDLSRQAFAALLATVRAGRATRQSLGAAGLAVIRDGVLDCQRARKIRGKTRKIMVRAN